MLAFVETSSKVVKFAPADIVKPESCTCVSVTSSSAPNLRAAASVPSAKLPLAYKAIFSVAASDAPVLKDNFVALLSAAKSPSLTAAISAATRIASVP